MQQIAIEKEYDRCTQYTEEEKKKKTKKKKICSTVHTNDDMVDENLEWFWSTMVIGV